MKTTEFPHRVAKTKYSWSILCVQCKEERWVQSKEQPSDDYVCNRCTTGGGEYRRIAARARWVARKAR